MGFKLRSATLQDIESVVRTFRSARAHNLPYLPRQHSAQEEINYFTNKVYSILTLLVVEQADTIVGFCAFDGEWVHHLYIQPEFQRQALGKKLLNEAKASTSELQLWVFQRNKSAIDFYRKNEFLFVEKTDGSANEENEPDALYRWQRKP